MSESLKREQNSSDTYHRKRQWQTVDSGEDTSSSSSDSGDDTQRKDINHAHVDLTVKEEKKSKRSKSDKKVKKDKKEKKGKKDKKDKKEKKEKKDRKSNGAHGKDRHLSASVNQDEYGKYGILKEEHFFQKQREFEVYMEEVKGIAGVMNEGKREVMMHFRSFMEDFNTATMPHPKFYDYERWEMLEYAKRQQAAVSESSCDDKQSSIFLNDEETVRQQRKLQRNSEELRTVHSLKQRMAQDRDTVDNMKRQSQIGLEMQLAFKRGDTETVKRLERALAPAPVQAVKHPWA